MKYRFVIITILCLVNFSKVFSEETKTEFSYKKICSPEFATEEMKKLNNLTKVSIQELNQDIEKLNDLEAKKTIKEDLEKIKNNYLTSVTKIKPTKYEDALINGLNYEAFRILLDKKAEDITNINATTICGDLPHSNEISFCKIISKESKENYEILYIDYINKNFENFKTSLINVNRNDRANFLTGLKDGYKLLQSNPDHIIHMLHESKINDMPPSMDVVKTEIDNSKEELKSSARTKTSLDDQKEINRLKNKINSSTSKSGKISKLEKVKNYLRKKIYHQCRKAYGQSSLDSNINQLKINCINESSISTYGDNTATSLAANTGEIISSLRASSNDLRSNGEVGLFLKSELDDIKASCDSISKEISLEETCRSVKEDKSEIKDKKESKDWDEFHKKYYMVPNPRAKNKKGYDVIEKKSNWKIFAESALPMALPFAANLWTSGMMFDSQLDLMTQQAIYNKQMNYMMDFNSPWFQANPYFQGNYYQFNGQNLNNSGFNF